MKEKIDLSNISSETLQEELDRRGFKGPWRRDPFPSTIYTGSVEHQQAIEERGGTFWTAAENPSWREEE